MVLPSFHLFYCALAERAGLTKGPDGTGRDPSMVEAA